MELALLVAWLVIHAVYRGGVGTYCAVKKIEPPWVANKKERLVSREIRQGRRYEALRSRRTMRGFFGRLWGDLWEDANLWKDERRQERLAWRLNGAPRLSWRDRAGQWRRATQLGERSRLVGLWLQEWWQRARQWGERWMSASRARRQAPEGHAAVPKDMDGPPEAPDLDTVAAPEPATVREPDAGSQDRPAATPSPDTAPDPAVCPGTRDGVHDYQLRETTAGTRRGCIRCLQGFGAELLDRPAEQRAPSQAPRPVFATCTTVILAPNGDRLQQCGVRYEVPPNERGQLLKTDCGQHAADQQAPANDDIPTAPAAGSRCPASATGHHDYQWRETTAGTRNGCIHCGNGFHAPVLDNGFSGDLFLSSHCPTLVPTGREHPPMRLCGNRIDPHSTNQADCGQHADQPDQAPKGRPKLRAVPNPSTQPVPPPAERDTQGAPQMTSSAEITNVQRLRSFAEQVMAHGNVEWPAKLGSAEQQITQIGLNNDTNITGALGEMAEAAQKFAAAGAALAAALPQHEAVAEQVSGLGAAAASDIAAYQNQ